MSYELIIDSCTDLPYGFVSENKIKVIPLIYTFRGEDHPDDFGQTLDYRVFYDQVRNGEMPTTSQINAYTYEGFFRAILEEGKDIVYLCFSSGLSGSYNNACLAAQQLRVEYPSQTIDIIDSKSASLGEGLYAWYLIDLMKKGASKEEILSWAKKNGPRMNHFFTVDDLNHLKRGGRVSGAAAFVGTILDIKPVLTVDAEGHLIPIDKVKGRKKSIKVLFEHLRERIENPEGQTIAISHGDAQEEASHLADMIREEFPVKEVLMNHIGPVVGAHSGPGTIALFFLGKDRSIE